MTWGLQFDLSISLSDYDWYIGYANIIQQLKHFKKELNKISEGTAKNFLSQLDNIEDENDIIKIGLMSNFVKKQQHYLFKI